MGTTVTTDEATVWADAAGLAALPAGATVQVWGLPGAPGVLLATRVEQRPPATPILSGVVQGLDTAARTFVLGSVVVDYATAAPMGLVDGQALANGRIVRVRGTLHPGRARAASVVQSWYPVPASNASQARLSAPVAAFAGLGSFEVLGTRVDASAAQVTGGPVAAIGNGVKLAVAGSFTAGGVLRATKGRIL